MSIGKEQILIVDDEEDIIELLRYNLTLGGYQVISAATGEEALTLAKYNHPDLIVLDLMLPGIDGLEVVKTLKFGENTKHIPIIMLTAKGEESDIVVGLELGADEYVTKPFSPKVLLARIKAIMRSRKEKNRKESGELDSSVIKIGGLQIHTGRRTVVIDRDVKTETSSDDNREIATTSNYNINNSVAGNDVVVIELTFTEFQILSLLARRPGWVFSRGQIVDSVRGDNYSVTERSVDVHIAGLRKKLGHYGKFIETVRGFGYRFQEN